MLEKKTIDLNDGFSLKTPKTRTAMHKWGLAVLRIWQEQGYPPLVGVGAEQLQTARAVLGLTGD